MVHKWYQRIAECMHINTPCSIVHHNIVWLDSFPTYLQFYFSMYLQISASSSLIITFPRQWTFGDVQFKVQELGYLARWMTNYTPSNVLGISESLKVIRQWSCSLSSNLVNVTTHAGQIWWNSWRPKGWRRWYALDLLLLSIPIHILLHLKRLHTTWRRPATPWWRWIALLHPRWGLICWWWKAVAQPGCMECGSPWFCCIRGSLYPWFCII